MKKVILVFVLVFFGFGDIKVIKTSKYQVKVTYIQDASIDKAIFYIHGYNDYFYNDELMQRAKEQGYNFYALDLHGYGKSIKNGKTNFYIKSVKDYYEEIDKSIEFIRQTNKKVILLAHSQGGLIATLYVADRAGMVDMLILNSPFFGFYAAWYEENLLIPIINLLGMITPTTTIDDYRKNYYDVYMYNLYHFNPNLKHTKNPPKHFGWFRAISKAQDRVLGGLDIKIPILLMHSSRSGIASNKDDIKNSDVVLDIEDMIKGAKKISNHTKIAIIKNGIHDLFLSQDDAKNKAYSEMFKFIKNN